MPILGPHLGALVGALVYQLCVGFHWPEPDSDVKFDVPQVTAQSQEKEARAAQELSSM